MSKIYEALLRAEQDRAEQDRTGKQANETKLPAFPSEAAAAAPTAAETSAAPVAAQPEPDVIAEIDTRPALANALAPTPAPTSFAAALAAPGHSTVSAAPAPTSFAAALATSANVAPAAPALPAPIPPRPSAPESASFTPALFEIAQSLPPSSPQTSASPAPAALPLRPSDDRLFAPDRVRRTPWTPSLVNLPALEERGAPVEQFRSLRSRMFEFRDLNKLKSILISSGLPQEGKSFIAANLAISFARHKASRVLLIDGDMRRSTLHKLLGAEGGIGLSEYLSGAAGLLDIMQQMETADDDSPARLGLASLTFIPGGSESEKAADLSGNPRFTQLMTALTPFYDWIVVDSAPVNIVADGVNLARACDGVLLVARGGVTKYESAQRALVELKASKILGFVLNAVESLPQTGGYYGYESYDSTQ